MASDQFDDLVDMGAECTRMNLLVLIAAVILDQSRIEGGIVDQATLLVLRQH